jgi:hypothetical protein
MCLYSTYTGVMFDSTYLYITLTTNRNLDRVLNVKDRGFLGAFGESERSRQSQSDSLFQSDLHEWQPDTRQLVKSQHNLFKFGTKNGRYRTRTCDSLLVRQELYQLS